MPRECIGTCRAPGICKLAGVWIRNFNSIVWLKKLPSEVLVKVAVRMGCRIVGRGFGEVYLQCDDNVLIGLNCHACGDYEYITTLDKTKVEVIPVLRVYLDKIVLDVNGLKVDVRAIVIDPFVWGEGFFTIFTRYSGRDYPIDTTLAYIIWDGSVTECVETDEPSMAPFIIEDALNNEYEKLNTVLEKAFHMANQIEYKTRDYLHLVLKNNA